MRKVLTQSSTACESLARPHSATTGSADVSASSSQAEPPVTHAPSVVLKRSVRPTFGISLNELKAAIAPRAEFYNSCSYDDADRYRERSRGVQRHPCRKILKKNPHGENNK